MAQPAWIAMDTKSTRFRLVALCLLLDISFLILMAIAGAGPVPNTSLYWGQYTGARVPPQPGVVDLKTGMWSYQTVGQNVIVQNNWWYSPFFVANYGTSLFYAIVSLQVIAGTTLFFGALTLAFLNPFPMLATGVFATVIYIPTFSMMAWLNNDLGNKVGPYESFTAGPGLGCGAAALALCLISTGIKLVAARKASSAISGEALALERAEEQEAKPEGFEVAQQQQMYPASS
ncbi:hypothetical protein DFJ74DRAFT_701588 [Hyaloraphidium curvatum]|nr:hypothetical protein DFJ74DRAFT_701588 [Hyaloraphidium curvatum]